MRVGEGSAGGYARCEGVAYSGGGPDISWLVGCGGPHPAQSQKMDGMDVNRPEGSDLDQTRLLMSPMNCTRVALPNLGTITQSRAAMTRSQDEEEENSNRDMGPGMERTTKGLWIRSLVLASEEKMRRLDMVM